jgi:hypothetical protein
MVVTSPIAPPPTPPLPTGPTQSSNGLAIGALIVGIVAFFIGLVPFLGLIAGALAVVLGVLSLRAGTRRVMGIVGIVLGGVAALTGLVTTIALVAGLAGASGSSATDEQAAAPQAASSSEPPAAVTPSAEPSEVVTEAAEEDSVAEEPAPQPMPGAEYGGYGKAEKKFVKVVETAADDYADTTNELKGARVLADRDADACKAFGNGPVSGWVGTIHDLGATGDGDGWVEIEIAPTIVVGTWNNAFSDIGDDTLIPQSAGFFDRLTELEVGDKVKFGGSFVKSDETCLETMNLTKTFNASDPNFLFRFSNVKPQ